MRRALPAALTALADPTTELGLRSGQVVVVEHNPQWAALYEAVAADLRAALRDLDAAVEHIGSTSVPGLDAKPVLDIAVGAAAPIDLEGYVDAIERTGFTYQTDLGIYGGLFFTASAANDVVHAHLHVVDRDDFQWRWYLALRDGLRNDATLRGEYAELKRQAAEANAESRDGYNQAKFDWVLATVSALDTPPG